MGQLVGVEASTMLNKPFGIVDLSLAPTPAVGDSVYSTDKGVLTTTSSGNTAINAKVKELDPDTGLVLIYLDGQF
jgi:uncharacterized protein (UPF0210 family)